MDCTEGPADMGDGVETRAGDGATPLAAIPRGLSGAGAAGPVIRPYRNSDLAPAAAFLRASFDPWPPRPAGVSPEDHLEWKLSSHPRAPVGQWVAEVDGRLVATHFSFVQGAWLRGREVIATTGVDSAVDEAYRGRHLYTHLREARFAAFREAFDMRFSRGAHAAVNAARDRSGETPFGNPVQALQAPIGGRISGLFRRRRPTDPGLVTLSGFDSRADDLWASARQGFDFAVDRGAARLNWRYADRRSGPATIRALTSERGALRGYTVLRPGRRALLADILIAPGDAQALDALLADALSCVRHTGAREVRTWLPASHPYGAAFRKAGFAPAGPAVGMRFAAARAPSEDVAFLAEPGARIHFTMGDTDAG